VGDTDGLRAGPRDHRITRVLLLQEPGPGLKEDVAIAGAARDTQPTRLAQKTDGQPKKMMAEQ
jgi:hypothetical protein